MNFIYKQVSLFILTFFFSLFLIGCSAGGGGTGNTSSTLSNSKEITSYSLVTPSGLESGIITDHSIYVTIPHEVSMKALAARYTTTGKTVSVNKNSKLIPQSSGITRNDFKYPVVYTVTAADGSTESYTVIVNHDKHYAYIFAPKANKIYMNQYEVSTGVMQPLSKPYINIESGNQLMSLDPLKRYVLLTNSNGAFTVFPINRENGMLESGIVSKNLFSTNNMGTTVISPSGKYIYQMLNADRGGFSTLFIFSIGQNGKIIKTPQELSNADEKFDIKFTSSGQYAYLSHYDLNSISMYSVDKNGGFSNQSESQADMRQVFDAGKIIIDPFDRYLYASSYLGQAIAMYKIDINTGALKPLDTSYIQAGIDKSSVMAVSKLGQYLYLSCSDGHNNLNICSYTINQKTGYLSFKDESPTQLPIYSMLVSPSGKYMYITTNTDNTLYTYSIDTDGKLHYINSDTYDSSHGPLIIVIN